MINWTTISYLLTVRPIFLASVASTTLAKGLSAPQLSTYFVILLLGLDLLKYRDENYFIICIYSLFSSFLPFSFLCFFFFLFFWVTIIEISKEDVYKWYFLSLLNSVKHYSLVVNTEGMKKKNVIIILKARNERSCYDISYLLTAH